MVRLLNVYYIQFLQNGEVSGQYKENLLMQLFNLKKDSSFHENIDKLSDSFQNKLKFNSCVKFNVD